MGYSLVLLTLGLVCAALGGEFFVRGSTGLGRLLRIPAAVVGATLAAFATSSPEVSVSINAALAKKPNISVGDALGSNVVNIGLVMGLALLIRGLSVSVHTSKRDYLIALLAPILTGLLMLDGMISRADAVLLLGLFSYWMFKTVTAALRHRADSDQTVESKSVWGIAASSLAGLALLVVAGRLIVFAAKGIAETYGVDPFLIGATLVAIGTSMPELATMLVARLRGQDDLGVGTLLGSNIFNGLVIIPIAALIHPIAILRNEVMVGLGFGLAMVISILPARGGWLSRSRGVWLILLYVLYLISLARIAA